MTLVLSRREGVDYAMKACQLIAEPVLLRGGETSEVMMQLTRVVASTLSVCFEREGLDNPDPTPLLSLLSRESRKMMKKMNQKAAVHGDA